mmetsp:Transcript_11467/g.37681  ORF Transcript_11467/g.37681 Transcript_11467/m.37681 type:complete len:201 (+) Transcript_11467:2778-3380(+)
MYTARKPFWRSCFIAAASASRMQILPSNPTLIAARALVPWLSNSCASFSTRAVSRKVPAASIASNSSAVTKAKSSPSTSPSRAARVVCGTGNPKTVGNSVSRRSMSTPCPTPNGPPSTNGNGDGGTASGCLLDTAKHSSMKASSRLSLTMVVVKSPDSSHADCSASAVDRRSAIWSSSASPRSRMRSSRAESEGILMSTN